MMGSIDPVVSMENTTSTGPLDCGAGSAMGCPWAVWSSRMRRAMIAAACEVSPLPFLHVVGSGGQYWLWVVKLLNSQPLANPQ